MDYLKKFVPYLIVFLAFFLQMRYQAELHATFPDSFGQQPFCGVDAKAHGERALGLLDGSIPGDKAYYFIPFYPFYLAAFHSFLGDALLLPIYVQALLQLVGIAALYSIGRLVYSSLAGALAALGLATYSYYLFYIPCFDQVLLTVPFLTLTIFFVLKFHRHQKSGWLILAGISFAATAFSRPTTLALLPVIVVWLYFAVDHRKNDPTEDVGLLPGRWASFGRNVIFLILPFVIAVAPITWHNYQASGRFILISDNFGVNLFTGNNPDAAGLDSLAHVQGQPAELRFRETVKREERGETTLTAEAVRYIIQQPGDWLALTATKTWLWFGEIDERLVSPFFPLSVSQSRTLAALPLEWRAAVIAALLGLVMVSGKSRQRTLLLWLVYGVFSLATIAFFIQLRFRLPFAPFVFLIAASLLAAAPRLKQESPRRYWVTLGAMLFLYPIVPGLWVFILIFAGFGLWPKAPLHDRFGNSRPVVLGLTAICIYLLAIGLWIRAEALASNVSQTIDHYLGPPLVAEGVLGQTFQMDCDGLNRIDLTLGVFNAQHDQPVTFYLATDLSAQEILYSETFAGRSVSDYQKKSFRFSPIANSAGKTFFFFISSPTSTPENAITIRGYTDTPLDRYPAGNAFAGRLDSLQRFEADIAFGAYCDLNTWQKLRRVFVSH